MTPEVIRVVLAFLIDQPEATPDDLLHQRHPRPTQVVLVHHLYPHQLLEGELKVLEYLWCKNQQNKQKNINRIAQITLRRLGSTKQIQNGWELKTFVLVDLTSELKSGGSVLVPVRRLTRKAFQFEYLCCMPAGQNTKIVSSPYQQLPYSMCIDSRTVAHF